MKIKSKSPKSKNIQNTSEKSKNIQNTSEKIRLSPKNLAESQSFVNSQN
jgi:hypothetical protein